MVDFNPVSFAFQNVKFRQQPGKKINRPVIQKPGMSMTDSIMQRPKGPKIFVGSDVKNVRPKTSSLGAELMDSINSFGKPQDIKGMTPEQLETYISDGAKAAGCSEQEFAQMMGLPDRGSISQGQNPPKPDLTPTGIKLTPTFQTDLSNYTEGGLPVDVVRNMKLAGGLSGQSFTNINGNTVNGGIPNTDAYTMKPAGGLSGQSRSGRNGTKVSGGIPNNIASGLLLRGGISQRAGNNGKMPTISLPSRNIKRGY